MTGISCRGTIQLNVFGPMITVITVDNISVPGAATCCLSDLLELLLDHFEYILSSEMVSPGDVVVPDIVHSYDTTEPYSSFTQRYFTVRYSVNVRHDNDDYRILIHSNRVCVITLAPSHELLKSESVTSVSFQVSENRNTLNTKISGKKKHNAQRLQPNTSLLIANCSSRGYKLVPGIHGKLLEVNKDLLTRPELLLTDPEKTGYLAIVLPDPSYVEEIKKTLLTPEAYQTHVDQCSVDVWANNRKHSNFLPELAHRHLILATLASGHNRNIVHMCLW